MKLFEARDKLLRVIVIYHDPSDFPGQYVARGQRVVPHPPGIVVEMEPLAVVDTLDEARAAVPEGMVRVERAPEDEPHIVEVWL